MIYGVYALFDSVRDMYSNLTVDVNDFSARRSFLQGVSDSPQLQYISKDLILYKIAEINLKNGMLMPLEDRGFIARGDEYASEK